MTAFKGGRAAAQKRYNSKPDQLKKRASRNKARRMMIKAGKAKKGDGKDVAHRNGNALDDRLSNFSLQSKRQNRSYPRTRGAHKRNPRD
jgi:hypothetical protein